MSEIITVGLDLAKNVFQVHGADASGLGVLRKKLRRDIEEVCPSTGGKQRTRGHRCPQNGVEVFWTRFNIKTIK